MTVSIHCHQLSAWVMPITQPTSNMEAMIILIQFINLIPFLCKIKKPGDFKISQAFILPCHELLHGFTLGPDQSDCGTLVNSFSSIQPHSSTWKNYYQTVRLF